MAGGWTRDGAVQDQIDDSVTDAVLRARALMPHGDSAEECDDCGEAIPNKRRVACPASAPASPASRSATVKSSTAPSTAAEARTASFGEAVTTPIVTLNLFQGLFS